MKVLPFDLNQQLAPFSRKKRRVGNYVNFIIIIFFHLQKKKGTQSMRIKTGNMGSHTLSKEGLYTVGVVDGL